MRLVQIFLPLYDNAGKRFPASLYARERETLVERFGGIMRTCRRPPKAFGETARRPIRMTW